MPYSRYGENDQDWLNEFAEQAIMPGANISRPADLRSFSPANTSPRRSTVLLQQELELELLLLLL